ncbi:hypothetical protein J2X71_004550 [Rhizobium sp. 1399]|nr:hypothetical protein [Rhizobium sp. 1399]
MLTVMCFGGHPPGAPSHPFVTFRLDPEGLFVRSYLRAGSSGPLLTLEKRCW